MLSTLRDIEGCLGVNGTKLLQIGLAGALGAGGCVGLPY
jgi:hypothetical protein